LPQQRPKHVGEIVLNKICNKHCSAFVGYLHVMNFIVIDLGLKRVKEVRICTSVNYLLNGSLNDSLLLFGIRSNGTSWHLHDFGCTVNGS